MAKFRLALLANLSRQMAFTPHDVRAVQIASAESLLHEILPEKAYPYDFVIFRITGYQPKTDGNSDLLTGLALQHDLGLLIERVSSTLDLLAADQPEPVLSINDVTERFDVTSKTIQRWRRKGLPARRLVFPDGKARVGFLLSSVERFIAAQARDGGGLVTCTVVGDAEQNLIARHARRLAMHGRCDINQICLRVGRKVGRSPLNILHTLRRHDAAHPADAVIPEAASELSAPVKSRIARRYKNGFSLSRIARKMRLSRDRVYHVLMQARVEKLTRRQVRFIDDPLYHENDAAVALDELARAGELPSSATPAEQRIPRDLPPYFRELYRQPLLTPAAERALFLKFNFSKFQFVSARRRLEPQFARSRDLEELENRLAAATAIKNTILAANLRLVVSVARRHVRPGVSLMELISEGNIVLMRAVEGFDVHKGNRFSTYATLALMKGFAQAVPALLRQAGSASSASPSARLVRDSELLHAIPDPRLTNPLDRQSDREQVENLLNRLSDRERQILHSRFGLAAGAAPASCEQLAQDLGLSKQRVRQIEQSALAKLRAFRS